MAHPRFEAVNLISDPVHGYIELTKRPSPEAARRAGLPQEEATEEDLLDSTWVQRLRRISQLQSARWVFPSAEHSRFTHGLGVMHEAGVWGRSLYPTLRATLEAEPTATGAAADNLAKAAPPHVPSEALVVETLRVAGLLHDVGHGPFAHFFDERVLTRWPAPPHPSRDPDKRLSHEDLGQAIVERELGSIIRGLRRAPGETTERQSFAPRESIAPAWISFLISKPPLVDSSMPRWVRLLQPLFSGVFTVDNLDYVRRDAYMTGVSTGPVDADRLRRYTFVSERGLALYEPGISALVMFLTARLHMYDTVYFHRTVRAIDLDLAEVFAASILALFGDRDPLGALDAYAGLDEYALLYQASRWARGESIAEEPLPAEGRVTPRVARLWRGILLRQPTWRTLHEERRHFAAEDTQRGREDLTSELSRAGERALADGRILHGSELRVDIAEADRAPEDRSTGEARLVVARRDGSFDTAGLGALLSRLPAFVMIGRLFVRSPERPSDE